MIRTRPFYLTALVATAAAMVVLVVAQRDGSSDAQALTSAETNFSVLKDAPTPGVPLSTPEGARVNPDSARLAQKVQGYETYVMSGVDMICISIRIPAKAVASGCSPIRIVASGERPPMVTIPINPIGRSEWLAATVVPDGTTNVRFPGGVPATIEKNVAFAIVAKQPEDMSFTAPDGTQRSLLGDGTGA